MDLGLGQSRVDDGARVVDVHDVQELHLAQGDIHLHLGEGAAEGVGVGLNLGGALGGDVLAVGQAVQGLGGQLAQGHQHPAVGDADNVAVHNVQVVGGHPGQLVGVFQDALLEQRAGLPDGEAGGVGLTGGVGAGAEGGHVGVLAGHHVDRLQGHAHNVRRHLGVGGVGALADLGLAQLDLEGAVLVEHHAAGGGLQGDGPHRRVVPEHSHAHATAHVAGLVLVLLVFAEIVHLLHALVHALVEGVGVELVLGEGVHIAHGHQVLPAELDGVQPQPGAHVLGVALHRPHGLGDAVAPHGACHRLVGEHGVGVGLHVVAGIELGEAAHALGGDAVAVGGVGPLVGEGLQLAGGVGAVGPHPGDDVAADGVAHPVGDKGVLPGDVNLDQVAPQLHAQPGAQGLVEHVLLVAEAAADVGLDDLNPAPGYSQGLAHHPADNVGNLGGADNLDPVPHHLCGTDKVLDVAVLDSGGVVPALHPDEARLLDGLLIVALPDGGVLEDIIGIFLVELGRPVLHGLLNVQDKGVLLVLHLDGPQGLGGGHLILRHHGGDVVAVEAHPVGEDQTVGHVLVALVGGPGVSRGGEIVLLLQVEAGEDPDHAGNGLCGRHIHGHHPAVGNGGVQNLGHIGPPVTQIVGIFCASGHLVIGVYPGNFLPYIHGAFLLFPDG